MRYFYSSQRRAGDRALNVMPPAQCEDETKNEGIYFGELIGSHRYRAIRSVAVTCNEEAYKHKDGKPGICTSPIDRHIKPYNHSNCALRRKT
jgi:hypothetical protein